MLKHLLRAGLIYLRRHEKAGPCRVLLANLCGRTRRTATQVDSQLQHFFQTVDFWLVEYERDLNPQGWQDHVQHWLDWLDEDRE